MPVEVHKHFNPDGELVGYTEIHRESPWDDDQRAQAEALFEAEQLICPKCGNPRELCSDPTRQWYPQLSTCYAKAAEEVADWRFKQKHERAKRTPEQPTLQTDGRHVWVSEHDLTPDDDFI